MSREVMQQALEALKNGKRVRNADGGTQYQPTLEDAAISAIEAELNHTPDAGKMVKQEPVLYIHPSTLEMASAHVGAWKPGHELPGYIALYAAAPRRQPLTEEEIDELWCEYPSDEFGFARAIEAAHEIKEKIE